MDKGLAVLLLDSNYLYAISLRQTFKKRAEFVFRGHVKTTDTLTGHMSHRYTDRYGCHMSHLCTDKYGSHLSPRCTPHTLSDSSLYILSGHNLQKKPHSACVFVTLIDCIKYNLLTNVINSSELISKIQTLNYKY